MDRGIDAANRPERAGGAVISIGKAIAAGLVALALAACATVPVVSDAEFSTIERNLDRHIQVLASDAYGGRRPASEGELLTLAYMRTELSAYGVESGTNDPANPWLAPVNLRRTQALDGKLEFAKGRKVFPVTPDKFFAGTQVRRNLLSNAEIWLAGSADPSQYPREIQGRVVLLIGANSKTSEQRDAAFEAGAAAVMIVVDDTAQIASLRTSRAPERFILAGDPLDRLSVYVARDAMTGIFPAGEWEALVTEAEQPDFMPRTVPLLASIEAASRQRGALSHNLIGRIPGTKTGSGAIILMGHWDHFGECETEDAEDRICNGAIDNASGIASLIELARRLQEQEPLDRDIYFLATTAEEWGLLGAKAFIASPPLPLEEIVAVLNFDSVAIAPRGSPVAFIGQGETPLDSAVLDAIERSGRPLGSQILADRFLRRQDSWAFLEQGIPAVAITSGLGNEDLLQDFLASRYHNSSDNADGLELGGAVEDLLLHEDLVRELGTVERYPRQ